MAETADEESIEELSESIEEVEAEFGELLEDVRDRVIQVKKETDAKAPLDHDHEDLASQIQTVSSDIERIDEELASLDRRLAGGFENFEEIIEFLLDRTDALRADLQTLGGAVVSIQNRVEQLSAREQARARADRLKNEAAAHGVKTAVCESCRGKVNLAMLSEATCPTCESVFRELEPNPGFFGSSTLKTGRRPALEGPSEVPDTDELASVVTGDGESSGEERPEWSPPSDSEADGDAVSDETGEAEAEKETETAAQAETEAETEGVTDD